jgi:PAS domain S-box-containing protein
MAILVLIALVPSVSVALIERSRFNADRARALQLDGRQTADAAGADVTAVISERLALLKALIRSPALKTNDLAAFYDHAKSVLDPEEGAVILLDRSPKMLLSTVAPFGAALPPSLNLAATRRAIETGEPQFSDLFTSPFTARPVLSVILAPRDSPYVLMATIRAEWLGGQLMRPTAAGWHIAVFDGAGRTAARSREAEQSVGRPASTATWAAVQTAPSGWAPTVTREGIAVYTAWKRLPGGWSVVASIDQEGADRLAESETKNVAIALGLGSLVAIAAWLLASAALTRRLQGLADAVIAFGHGGDVAPPRSRVSEVDAAAQALMEAMAQRRRADGLLRAQEAKHEAVIATAVDAIVVIDSRGVVQSANPATTRLFGYDAAEMIGNNVSMLMPASDRAMHDGYIDGFLKTGVAKIIGQGREVEGRRKDGSRFPVDLSVVEWRMGEARYFTGVMRDISDRRAREEHVRFLLGEVNHRSKNLLAVVQAIARQTAGSNSGFAEKFGGRLQALAANQDMLVSNEWRGIDMKSLVAKQVDLFGDILGERISIDGPSLELSAESTQAIAMALHELATNAIKHGALSNDVGKVEIAWACDKDAFRLRWSESGGATVAPPARGGFGAVVIEKMLERAVGGEAGTTFAATGIVWELRCPLANVLARPVAAPEA